MAADEEKPREQLLRELKAARRRVVELEAEVELPGRGDRSAVETNEQFRSLFRAMIEGVALHEVVFGAEGKPVNYRIIDVNPAYESHTGISAAQACGRLATEVYGVDKAPYLSEYVEVTKTGTPAVFETYFPPLEKQFKISVFRFGAGQFASVFEDVTARYRMERELQGSEARYRTIIETAPAVFIVLSPEGNILEFNPEAERVYGSRRAEVLGRNYAELFLPADVRPGVVEELNAVVAGKPSRGFENRIRCASGEERTFVWNADCLKDDQGGVIGVVAIGEDITELRSSEQTLRLTQYCMDHAAVDTFWIGPEAELLRVNKGACENLGYTSEELGRMHVYDIDPNFSRDRWPEHWERLRQLKSMRFETIHRRKDGSLFPVEINNNYLEFNGQELNFSFAHDISERKRAEEERRKLESQVQQTQKLESLGVLAGGIAHDFNNLLMAVLGNAELALQDISDVSPARPMLEEIRRTARRAAELCKQMLAYSGKGRFVVKALNLSELVAEMGHMLEVSISKKAAMRFSLAQNLPAVEADATQMRQVIMNLLINASEAIGDQSGVIAITTGSVLCDREYLRGMHLDENLPEGLYAYLEVSDTGCGMDAETARRLFDPFFTTKFMGRGLGMAAVLGIVRGHRGAIKVYSELGKGTTFKILLPSVDNPVEAEAPEKGETSPWRTTGLVLLVDDEETIRLLGQRMLERMGFSVVLASDGVEALEIYRERASEITCVLLDLTMPNLDGEETFRELRRIDPKARVVMSSGYNQQEVVTRFVGRGLAGFVQKPYTIPELTAVMKQVLAPK